ncbi:MAG: single-stranded DNA-binding protein [Oxalobacteraceae bacterium]|nr:single-stranded DNA-binding protein [Oxalobacteraceae bacterium]
MASVNKVIIVGNLGRDPETRYMPSGDAMTNIAKLAEIAGQYLKKGSQVYVEGKLRTRKWTDKDGIEKYSTEVIADSMQMLGSRQGMGGGSAAMDDASYGSAPAKTAASGARAPAKQAPSMSDMDDDIPF